jgi:Na+/melibiose symporter-like transporter
MTTRTLPLATTSRANDTAAERRDHVSWRRLFWVAPLTVVMAVLVNVAIATLLRAINPDLNEMGQLGRSNMILTLEGSLLAVIVFALMVWLVPHPIRWYRIVGVIALLISLIPDLLLGFGGAWRVAGTSMVAPFSRFGAMFFPSGSGGGRRASPPAGEVLPGLPWDRVLILMTLHVAAAIVCIVLLTTLTRDPAPEGASRQQ